MVKHPSFVEGFNGSLDDLVKSIGKMRYDVVSSFIEKLAGDIKRQGDNDYNKGRTKLASKLYETADELYKAKEQMDAVWKICAPYMKD